MSTKLNLNETDTTLPRLSRSSRIKKQYAIYNDFDNLEMSLKFKYKRIENLPFRRTDFD